MYEEVDVNDIDLNDVYPISVTWNITDEGDKKKARLVARGFQEDPLQKTKTVSPTCRKESLRLLFTITASKKWTVKSIDISSAFLQGQQIERTVYLIPPREHKKKNVLWKLKKCVYGLSDAAKMWYETVKDKILEAKITKCPHDDALFYYIDEELEGIMSHDSACR